MLKENERLDDLEYKSLFIIQNKDGYCFTSDSVLLANSVRVLPKQRVVDLGTGSGVIALLLAGKTKAEKIYGIEIQKSLADMAERSVFYNKLQERVEIINDKMQGIHKKIGSNFDVVVTNPPYERAPEKPEFSEQDICKCECTVTLEEVTESASKLLKHGGLFYMVNKAKRLAEMMYLMKKYNIEPKRLIFVQPKASKEPDTVIVEAKKGGKPHLTVEKPLIVYNEDGSMTEEARRIYGK